MTFLDGTTHVSLPLNQRRAKKLRESFLRYLCLWRCIPISSTSWQVTPLYLLISRVPSPPGLSDDTGRGWRARGPCVASGGRFGSSLAISVFFSLRNMIVICLVHGILFIFFFFLWSEVDISHAIFLIYISFQIFLFWRTTCLLPELVFKYFMQVNKNYRLNMKQQHKSWSPITGHDLLSGQESTWTNHILQKKNIKFSFGGKVLGRLVLSRPWSIGCSAYGITNVEHTLGVGIFYLMLLSKWEFHIFVSLLL